MTRNDVLKLFPDATDEQITNLLNKSGEEMAREKEKANQYKAKADKADELQTQLDELQAGNMTELEKANKALDTANQQIAKLQKDNAVRDLRESAMSDFGITAEQAKTVVKEDGSFDTTSLGKIISDMKANAIDVTMGDAPGTYVYQGTIDWEKVKSLSIVDEARTATPRVTFYGAPKIVASQV